MGCANSANVVDGNLSIQNKYELGSKLGEGGFATVHMGRSKLSQKDCAVKTMHLRGRGQVHFQNMRSVAENEVTMWRRLGPSEHCVQLIEVFMSASVCHVVMELCEATLSERVSQLRAMGEDAISRAFRQMLLGIAHVHAHSVAHRDVKPSNFLLGGRCGWSVKLCDFGLAAAVPTAGTLTGVVGSSLFMSPELVGGLGYTEKTDVWSFGASCYSVLFGDVPYRAQMEWSKREEDADAARRADMDTILRGHPAPVFCAEWGTASFFVPSASASDFVRLLLERSQEKRLCAGDALREDFVQPRAVSGDSWRGSKFSLSSDEPNRSVDTTSTWSDGSMNDSLSFASGELVRSNRSIITIPRAAGLAQAAS